MKLILKFQKNDEMYNSLSGVSPLFENCNLNVRSNKGAKFAESPPSYKNIQNKTGLPNKLQRVQHRL